MLLAPKYARKLPNKATPLDGKYNLPVANYYKSFGDGLSLSHQVHWLRHSTISMAHHETLEVAQVIAEGSSASEKQKEETIEDDDLYCLQSSFVFFQVRVLSCHWPRISRGTYLKPTNHQGWKAYLPRSILSFRRWVYHLRGDVQTPTAESRCWRVQPRTSHYTPSGNTSKRFSQLSEGTLPLVSWRADLFFFLSRLTIMCIGTFLFVLRYPRTSGSQSWGSPRFGISLNTGRLRYRSSRKPGSSPLQTRLYTGKNSKFSPGLRRDVASWWSGITPSTSRKHSPSVTISRLFCSESGSVTFGACSPQLPSRLQFKKVSKKNWTLSNTLKLNTK